MCCMRFSRSSEIDRTLRRPLGGFLAKISLGSSQNSERIGGVGNGLFGGLWVGGGTVWRSLPGNFADFGEETFEERSPEFGVAKGVESVELSKGDGGCGATVGVGSKTSGWGLLRTRIGSRWGNSAEVS